ncbi:BTAD domain-containing putative transcriptional regulator [Amycolatopsis sp. NPDC059657]|uniref:AfsR/SARP family transcriptional regulator n=1 Tax=Amycolatopsis sp. NPDC059657 TaxID=3346899 RepID=UPI003671DCF7
MDGGVARLETRPGGYLMVVRPGELDLTVFKDLVRLARQALRESRHPEAVELFGRALGLWRGEPLANVALLGGAEADLARLGETRLAVLEDYLRARLTCGEHADVAGELQGLVVEHPLRESLWALLVHALHHAGRRAEALLAYNRARTQLADELGLDPGPDLREAHARLLAGDPLPR